MNDSERLSKSLNMALRTLSGLLFIVLLEAWTLWHTAKFSENARWTSRAGATMAILFFLIGAVSVRRGCKQIAGHQ
jgi:hypothetical protein